MSTGFDKDANIVKNIPAWIKNIGRLHSRPMPEELKQYISYLDIPLPDNSEINELIDNHIQMNDFDQFQDEDRLKLMPSLSGMSSY